jgi:hypothetical protein
MQTVIARQVVALALTCVSSAIAQQAPRVSRDSVQRVVRERVSSGRSPGLAVGVLNPDGSTYIVWSSRDAAHPVNERSIFEIGSITKAFTGILLADLVLRGVVSLDQPVAELLPADTRICPRRLPGFRVCRATCVRPTRRTLTPTTPSGSCTIFSGTTSFAAIRARSTSTPTSAWASSATRSP